MPLILIKGVKIKSRACTVYQAAWRVVTGVPDQKLFIKNLDHKIENQEFGFGS